MEAVVEQEVSEAATKEDNENKCLLFCGSYISQELSFRVGIGSFFVAKLIK